MKHVGVGIGDSMAPSIMKAVLIFIPLWIVMLIEVIISPFGGVKQNEN